MGILVCDGASRSGAQSVVRNDWSEPERQSVLLVEDDSGRTTRRGVPGIPGSADSEITVRLHQIENSLPVVVGKETYDAGTLDPQMGRSAVALALLDRVECAKDGVVVAGTAYGMSQRFLKGLCDRGLNFAIELPPSALVRPASPELGASWGTDTISLDKLLHRAQWQKVEIVHPTTNLPIDYLWADFGVVQRQGIPARLFVLQTGEIQRLQRGTIFTLVSDDDLGPEHIISAVGWSRWIRPFVRKLERAARSRDSGANPASPVPRRSEQLPTRVNITVARQQDQVSKAEQELPLNPIELRGILAGSERELRIAELFAGAGGMGLGFLLAGNGDPRYRLVYSGEVHPIYVETLRRNHRAIVERYARQELVPDKVEPVDLRTQEAMLRAERACRDAGGIDVLIGGPPCQGFSSANRNSGHSANPNNQLVDVFLSYVERLRPRVFLMENVQGIVWTPKASEATDELSVAEDFTRRMQAAGYLVFPKLLDAVWFGVPQHRNRFFILGISHDLGYHAEDFGTWGPFPRPTHGPSTGHPYVTVRDAIGDLPSVWNGYNELETSYGTPKEAPNEFLREMREGAPADVIWDHVTSRHAEYVIERFVRIPPGGNWRDIAHFLSNYSNIERTHSNIYRRLAWDEPSITIGHYRKSMIVHPSQARGLSLREACRLQSFPDWFRFAGSKTEWKGGLAHKQQQIANAVCPLVTKAIAEFIIQL